MTAPAAFNLADIQGNILTAYGRLGFPKGRNLLFNIRSAEAGRAFVAAMLPHVTSALRWSSPRAPNTRGREVPRPEVTINLAFTFEGLLACGVPVRTLRGFPDEFIQGMRARAALIGDDFPANVVDKWDGVWTGDRATAVHLLVMLNAQMDDRTGLPVAALDVATDAVRELAEAAQGVALLRGHGPGNAPHQDLSAVLRRVDDRYEATALEHFGYFDGVSDPVFAGQHAPQEEAVRVRGNGRLGADGVWRPLAAGEFLLGHPDEAQEIPPGPMPLAFARNGTFMAYRKLQQNVGAFDAYLDTQAAHFGAVYGIADPAEARATLMAKFAGRWADGVPLAVAPTYADWERFNERTSPAERATALADHSYVDDPHGYKCPAASHVRRVNPRDALGPWPMKPGRPAPSGSILSNRRRILRRGLPYGVGVPGEREPEVGIVMLCLCANLFRQFEFVQQQWLNYGLDAGVGNDGCPLLGNHGPAARFTVPADPARGGAPFIAPQLPQFVETRGGAYFFVPSIPALSAIASGAIDPT